MFSRIVIAAVVGFGVSLGAQQPSVSPEEAAAVKRLEYFIGQWKLEGTWQDELGGKAKSLRGTQQCEWFEIRAHVICRGETIDASLTRKEVVILAYNSVLAVYTRYNVDGASGGNGYSTGKVSGKDWQWTLVYPQTPNVQVRSSWTEVSPDVHTIMVDASEDGKAFTTLAEARVTRVK